MQSKKLLLLSYAIILTLGITAMLTKIHYFANIAGFIGAIGLMFVFFKDPITEDMDEDAVKAEKALKLKWYVVFFTGIIFSLIFGSFWNDDFGNMS